VYIININNKKYWPQYQTPRNSIYKFFHLEETHSCALIVPMSAFLVSNSEMRFYQSQKCPINFTKGQFSYYNSIVNTIEGRLEVTEKSSNFSIISSC
jgi:hypothetical protein